MIIGKIGNIPISQKFEQADEWNLFPVQLTWSAPATAVLTPVSRRQC